MDIPVDAITEAMAAGEIAAGNITSFHPVTAAGLARWISVVGVLRERLADTEWSPDNPLNRPISKHTTRGYTLSTVGGTDATGVEDHPQGPLAARRKGKSTAEAVNNTLALISVETLRGSPKPTVGETPPEGNWFLVYHRTRDEGTRLEVSLPSGFDEEAGQFTGWQVRVILPSWQSEDTTTRPLDVGGQDVDFHVREVS
ncbi:hypothetical protein G4H71_08780 [Rhodococcus triatomae]|nr:hypothetical protein [Rhodococcus triatomae]QNG20970.1 hypothetical protein G4H72_21605 [Rhodococcus triatomae]QNG23115.1 hypothetical protein G4H71_08780 [Rhodococcus triatomae]